MKDFNFPVLNSQVDISHEFCKIENTFFNAGRVTEFDPRTASGILEWKRYTLQPSIAINQARTDFYPDRREFPHPPSEMSQDYELPISLSFITPRTVRLRLSAREAFRPEEPSLMVTGSLSQDNTWQLTHSETASTYQSAYGSVTINREPGRFEFRDAAGRLLTCTQNMADTSCLSNAYPQPLSFVRCVEDLSRHIAASFTLAPDEKLFGAGESFTRLNKRGQKIVLWAKDALGVQTDQMYKPIPFFLSSRGYAMFVHTSAPLTFDFGQTYDQANVIYLGDTELDLFFFFGKPKEVLSEYTALTGRSPLPPLWSFGLWMSQMDCHTEAEVRALAARLRQQRIPCDVLHLDTQWFENYETDWSCDFQFSPSRFPNPVNLIANLKAQGFRISLWQYPYLTPPNALRAEAIKRGYVVRSANGDLPTEDAILDLSRPEAVQWYQSQLATLLKMGVGAIKVDFGEEAPRHGLFASGKTGFYEHNLYPLRYNKAVADITRQVTGEAIIWARSAWAGSQRYPMHWGGDVEIQDCAMAATLRGGLSLGLCGFSFWSHDIGGFTKPSPRNLYQRWLPFGLLTSHSRCHGVPPKVPWAYDEEFVSDFRRAVELKYRLMPYVYAQAALSAQAGFPMLRPLFFEFPEDLTAWFIEDEYFFGSDLLVAPLMEELTGRDVYLPLGQWVDYQTGHVYKGGQWQHIEVGEIPVVLLVKSGAAIPHIALAQSTAQMDWSQIELVVFGIETTAEADLCLPCDNVLRRVRIKRQGEQWQVDCDPIVEQITLSVHAR